eukprot:scaffold20659_cov64-Phaeocystis_antarctica.AAC.10
MFVTLDVSKLSGQSNDDAPCRVAKGGHVILHVMRGEVRAGRRKGVGRRRLKRHVRGGRD